MIESDIYFVLSNPGDEKFKALYFRYFSEIKQYIPEKIDPIETWYNERYGYDDILKKYYIYANNCIIGLLILQYVDSGCGVDPPIWYLVEFYILPEYRRKRYGIRAAEKVFDMCDHNIFYYVLKGNKTAIAFWNAVELRLHLIRIFRPELLCDDGVELRVIRKNDC